MGLLLWCAALIKTVAGMAASLVIYLVLLLVPLASCESARDAPLILYESPHGLVVLKAARVDFAAEDEEAIAARSHFADGEEHLGAGRCGAAAAHYLQAAARRPSPAVWLNAGVALLCAGEYGKAGALDYIGHIFFRQGKIDAALASFEKALHVFTQAGNRRGEAAQLSNIGNIYFEQGRLDEALKAFGDALHVFQLIGHRQGEAQSLGNIGLVYRKKGARARALEALQQARTAYTEIGVQSAGRRTVEEAIRSIEGP